MASFGTRLLRRKVSAETHFGYKWHKERTNRSMHHVMHLMVDCLGKFPLHPVIHDLLLERPRLYNSLFNVRVT